MRDWGLELGVRAAGTQTRVLATKGGEQSGGFQIAEEASRSKHAEVCPWNSGTWLCHGPARASSRPCTLISRAQMHGRLEGNQCVTSAHSKPSFWEGLFLF